MSRLWQEVRFGYLASVISMRWDQSLTQAYLIMTYVHAPFLRTPYCFVDTVVVPLGQAILVDVSPPRLDVVVVEGDMVFDRMDLTLDANFIFVFGGHLEIGTEAEPFLNDIVVTIHGTRATDAEMPDIGAKGIVVME